MLSESEIRPRADVVGWRVHRRLPRLIRLNSTTRARVRPKKPTPYSMVMSALTRTSAPPPRRMMLQYDVCEHGVRRFWCYSVARATGRKRKGPQKTTIKNLAKTLLSLSREELRTSNPSIDEYRSGLAMMVRARERETTRGPNRKSAVELARTPKMKSSIFSF